MAPDTECACGDVLDEHDDVTWACCVEGCDCIYFESADDDHRPSAPTGQP